MTERIETLPPPCLYAHDERLSSPVSIELDRPIKHGAESLTAIEMRPLQGQHVRQIGSDLKDVDFLLQLAGRLTGLPDSVLDQLTADDVGRVIGAVQGMLWPAIDLPNVGRDANGEPEMIELPRLVQPFELALEKALKVGDRDEITVLRFHEVTGKVARTFPSGAMPVSKLPALVCKLTRLPGEAIDRLEGMDLRNALGVAQCFFGSIRATGPGSGAF